VSIVPIRLLQDDAMTHMTDWDANGGSPAVSQGMRIAGSQEMEMPSLAIPIIGDARQNWAIEDSNL
jgi:hypothetical protein